MIITRVVAASTSLLLMAMLGASNAQAQACGNSFADISILDAEGNECSWCDNRVSGSSALRRLQ